VTKTAQKKADAKMAEYGTVGVYWEGRPELGHLNCDIITMKGSLVHEASHAHGKIRRVRFSHIDGHYVWA
jgi:hypothetical protein